jgi:hypothetical protein
MPVFLRNKTGKKCNQRPGKDKAEKTLVEIMWKALALS